MKKLDVISLIGVNRIFVEKEITKHGFELENYGNYGDRSYSVFTGFLGNRTINIKYKVEDKGEFAETIIIC